MSNFQIITMKRVLLSFCLLLTLSSATSVYSQEYERVWGTYFGPAGTELTGSYINQGIVFDSQKNMHVRGHVWHSSIYNTSYYNQFVIGSGSNYIIQSNQDNGFTVRFSPSGIPDYFGYFPYLYSNNNTVELLLDIDSQDNTINTQSSTNSSINATPGTWLQTNPQTTINNMIVKRSPTGNVIWATYLPDILINSNVTTDPNGNIYIAGKTLLQNLSTPGVYQENFDLIYSQGNIVENEYLVKLNSNGELIWATYLPSAVAAMEYYDNALYMITTRNTNIALNTMASPGAFQSTVSDFSVTKINTQNGQRVWGTYYGPASAASIYFLYDLAVNETGLYLVGTDYNLNDANIFATSNAYKTQVTGASDLFLTKFSHAGDRQWSTYFGGNGEDFNIFDKVIDLNGPEIFICGTTYGSTNNIATPGSYQDAPQSSTNTSNNSFFAKFNAAGNLDWSSYYGGTSTNTSYLKTINIKYDNNSLFLFGCTNSNTGFTTEEAFMPARNPNNTTANTGFFARLNKKEILSVEDTSKNKDLVLYNNPNNGIFSLSGSILKNTSCVMTIYDMSGKLIIKKNLERNKDQKFNLQNLLSSGNYLIQINNEKGEKLKVFKMTVKK